MQRHVRVQRLWPAPGKQPIFSTTQLEDGDFDPETYLRPSIDPSEFVQADNDAQDKAAEDNGVADGTDEPRKKLPDHQNLLFRNLLYKIAKHVVRLVTKIREANQPSSGLATYKRPARTWHRSSQLVYRHWALRQVW